MQPHSLHGKEQRVRLDRLNEMEQYILDQGTASLEDLCQHFQVSMNTVRRDLSDLLERGRLKKVYGGVSAESRSQSVIPMSERASRNGAGKQIIGKLASSLVQDGMSIFLDSGSTTVRILPYLTDKKNVTVITHSLMALYEAAKYPQLNVIALGGMYNTATSSFVGSNTLDELSKMAINLVFLGATGVTLERGLTNTTYFEVEAEGGRIILTPVRISREDAVQPARGWRAGWDQQFRDMAERGDDQLLDAPTPTDWEADEWEW